MRIFYSNQEAQERKKTEEREPEREKKKHWHSSECKTCSIEVKEPGSTVPHTPSLGESASSEATDNPLTVQLQYEVLFGTCDVVAVKHARRREQFSFFLPWS